jgi:CBS domain containing-hemolysin-like protein
MVPFVVVIESSAAAITRALHLKGHGHGNAHTAEERKLIVSSSRGLGYLPEAEEDMIHRVLDLERGPGARDLIPGNDIVSIPLDATLDEVLHTMNEQRHSRLPVYDKTPEKIIGLLHYKDLLPVGRSGASPSGPAGRAVPSASVAFSAPGLRARHSSRSRRCSTSSARAAPTWR